MVEKPAIGKDKKTKTTTRCRRTLAHSITLDRLVFVLGIEKVGLMACSVFSATSLVDSSGFEA